MLLASLLKPSDAKEGLFSKHYNTPNGFREGLETRDEEASNHQAVSNGGDTGKSSQTRSQFSRHYNTPDSFREGVETQDEVDDKVTVDISPEQFTRHYNTPDKFREGFESRDLNTFETRKQSIVHPDEFLHELNDDNEVPDNSPGMYLGAERDATMPGDETLPEEFRTQEGETSDPRLSPEIKELTNMYYNTDNGLPRSPKVTIISEVTNVNDKADSEGKAYTEGGLMYLSKQNRGKNSFGLSKAIPVTGLGGL
jgi:hypothetical protein